jgi:acyl carrier protein
MMTEQQVKEAILAAGINVDVDSLKPSDNLSDAGIDSLDFFNLFLELETIGGKKIPDDQLDKMTTIDSIIKFYAE